MCQLLRTVVVEKSMRVVSVFVAFLDYLQVQFCSGRRSLMRSDNELCFIYTFVAQRCYVTLYWLLQTDSVNIVRCTVLQ